MSMLAGWIDLKVTSHNWSELKIIQRDSQRYDDSVLALGEHEQPIAIPHRIRWIKKQISNRGHNNNRKIFITKNSVGAKWLPVSTETEWYPTECSNVQYLYAQFCCLSLCSVYYIDSARSCFCFCLRCAIPSKPIVHCSLVWFDAVSYFAATAKIRQTIENKQRVCLCAMQNPQTETHSALSSLCS